MIAAMNTSACAMFSQDFDCPYEKGVGCKSITEVNHMVDTGQFKSAAEGKSLAEPIVMSDKGMIQRISEEHLRVWVAPHQDEQGNFHEASVVHTVIKPGYWNLVEKP